jgi:hypothetical protein
MTVLLFQKRFHAGIVDGAVRLTFRLWDKPRVKAGGRYRVHPIGVVEVERVDHVTWGELTDADAKAGGFESRADLLAYLGPVAKSPLTPKSKVFRVAFHHGGDGDRVSTALETNLTPEDVAAIEKRRERELLGCGQGGDVHFLLKCEDEMGVERWLNGRECVSCS